MTNERQPTNATRPKAAQKAIRRAVSSSTALETGQSIATIESKLSGKRLEKFRHLTLAD